jgi:pyrimidine-nucleoside phosphorylase/thymidine phosphorylase
MGKKMVALITNMDQPLGRMVGNATEVFESIEVLTGGGPNDLRDLCLELASWMFYLGGAVATTDEGKKLAEQLISSGKAFAKFRQLVEMHKGDVSVIDNPSLLPAAKRRVDVPSPENGYVTAIQCESIGTACVLLGGGREKKEDSVDPAVGIVVHKKVGDQVAAEESLCTILCHSDEQAQRAKKLIEESYEVSPGPPAHRKSLVHRVIHKGEH